MTQAMQQLIRRLERLPAIQDRYIRRFSKELEEELSAEQKAPSEETGRVPKDRYSERRRNLLRI